MQHNFLSLFALKDTDEAILRVAVTEKGHIGAWAYPVSGVANSTAPEIGLQQIKTLIPEKEARSL
jgi:hypothetical protein